MVNNEQFKGIKFALVTALISGISIFVNKFAVGAIKPPIVFIATKNFGVGFLILMLIIFSRKWKLVKKLNKREITQLILIGLIGGAIPFYLFFTGISQIPAINAALLHKTLVFWVALLAVPFLKEKISKIQVLAITLLFASNLLVGGFKGFTLSTGEFLVLLATVLWAVENVVAKKLLKNVDPDLLTGARMGIGSLFLIGASVFTAPQDLSTIFNLSSNQVFWLVLTIIALFGYVSSWYRALKFAPTITVASVLVSSTLITNILSAFFITYTWKLVMLPQAGLVIAGLGLFLYSEKRKHLVYDF